MRSLHILFIVSVAVLCLLYIPSVASATPDLLARHQRHGEVSEPRRNGKGSKGNGQAEAQRANTTKNAGKGVERNRNNGKGKGSKGGKGRGRGSRVGNQSGNAHNATLVGGGGASAATSTTTQLAEQTITQQVTEKVTVTEAVPAESQTVPAAEGTGNLTGEHTPAAPIAPNIIASSADSINHTTTLSAGPSALPGQDQHVSPSAGLDPSSFVFAPGSPGAVAETSAIPTHTSPAAILQTSSHAGAALEPQSHGVPLAVVPLPGGPSTAIVGAPSAVFTFASTGAGATTHPVQGTQQAQAQPAPPTMPEALPPAFSLAPDAAVPSAPSSAAPAPPPAQPGGEVCACQCTCSVDSFQASPPPPPPPVAAAGGLVPSTFGSTGSLSASTLAAPPPVSFAVASSASAPTEGPLAPQTPSTASIPQPTVGEAAGTGPRVDGVSSIPPSPAPSEAAPTPVVSSPPEAASTVNPKGAPDALTGEIVPPGTGVSSGAIPSGAGAQSAIDLALTRLPFDIQSISFADVVTVPLLGRGAVPTGPP
ncbi:hypothetical protein P152DRAFT_485649 [Eremomyces bilateralis CBS 781.70]|uniref:Uncharacterized protein n=1 Tax=Eremomyces bilateralis CBS 781.70 TaxID=1392243 RepID=A0A6G1FR95_9PEZI|nr:uncharacterized protein P152DRAFT_485649 [Eremomyces bilateralis CBS 781.70]KAF1808209.1 hypothetical protein P152DRAFT_485649 [Eremomyces bilateralis CBS 781.70]